VSTSTQLIVVVPAGLTFRANAHTYAWRWRMRRRLNVGRVLVIDNPPASVSKPRSVTPLWSDAAVAAVVGTSSPERSLASVKGLKDIA
jgi:hypothetical protein